MGSEHGLAVKELVPRSVGRSVGLGGREGGRGPFVRVRGGGGGAFKCHVGRRWDRRRRPFLKREKGLGRACSRDVGKRGALKIPGPTGGERAAAAGAAGGDDAPNWADGERSRELSPSPSSCRQISRGKSGRRFTLFRPSPRQSTLFPRLPRSLNVPFGQGRDKRGVVTEKEKKLLKARKGHPRRLFPEVRRGLTVSSL